MLRGKMSDCSLQLSAADQLTRAVKIGALATDLRSADRAVVRHAKGGAALFTIDWDTLGNCRNYVTSPFDLDGIADPNVFPDHFIGIVQRRSADGDPTDLHGFQKRGGREGSGSPDGDNDILHNSNFLAREKLIGNGPTGTTRLHAETALPVSAIHFHHNPINFKGQLIPHQFRFSMKRHDLLD